MKLAGKVVTFLLGLAATLLGLNAILTQELFAQGSVIKGAGWHMQGLPAVLAGVALLSMGLYIVWLTFTLKE